MADMLALLLEHPEAAGMNEAVRTRHAKDAHASIQAELRSMFESLPKNEYGNIEIAAARYALHRLFEHRHRWFVRGLHPKVQGAKDASGQQHIVGKAMQMLTVLDFKFPEGITLASLAALAGTLEELIQREVSGHLEDIYKSLGKSVDDVIPGKTLQQVTEAYMTIYISGADWHKTSEKDIMTDDVFMKEHTKGWNETQQWVRSTTLEAMRKEESCKGEVSDCRFPVSESTRVVETVIKRYGFYNDRECHKLKTGLLELEQKRSGRVTLANFYKAGLSGAWSFNEKVDYLRALGTLDESSKDDPKVIVANYVGSWVNCLSSSKYYSVCCRNECEDYMRVLEKHIAGPSADPDKIMRLIETQSVLKSELPKALPALRHRLVSIADRHRGKVPIHGRLFSQWMHHAFPSTCPYPHESGTTNPQTPDEWMMETGHRDIKASEDEVHEIVKQASQGTAVKSAVAQQEEEGELPWSDVEELIVIRPTQKPQEDAGIFDKLLTLMEAITVLALVGFLVWATAQHRRLRMQQHKGHKF
jgi:hypothetical protein